MGQRWRRPSAYPRRLQVVAVVLPSLLLAGLIALDYFLLERLLPPGESHLVQLVIGVAGVVAFSTAIFARLSELTADLEAKRQTLQALNAAGLSLSAELDTQSVLQKIADLARPLANARYAALGVFDDEGHVRTFHTSGITPEERARIGALPQGHGLLGLLQREHKPIRLRDLKAHPSSVPFPPHHPPMHSFLGVPILWRGHPVGNLYLTEKIGAPEFTEDDEAALLTLAAQAAIAIENARLYEQAARVSVLEERHRIGMDLHDGAIQSLYGIGLLVEDAAGRVEEAPAEVRSTLTRAVDRLNAAIADLRGYVLGLRPIHGSDRPLAESLPTLATQVGQNALIEVEVTISPEAERSLRPDQREAVFFIAADALGNVARHARARTASVRLVREGGQVVLEVRDDGVGFDPQAAVGGFGLRNMRQRAFASGGRLSVQSRPGQGTQLLLELPTAEEGTR